MGRVRHHPYALPTRGGALGGPAAPPAQGFGEENHYRELLDSGAFLYAFLGPRGELLLMNQGMRDFLGKPAPESLFSCCLPGQEGTLRALLRDAERESISAVVPLRRGDGRSVWMDVELSPSSLMGKGAIRVLGADVTDWAAAVVPETPPQPQTPPDSPLADAERTGILEAIAVRAAVVNENGVCLAANVPLTLSLGGKAAGRRFLELIPWDDPANEEFHRQFPLALQARSGRLACRLPGGDGEVLWLEVHLRPLEWRGFRAVLLTCEDVTLLRRTREQLRRAATVDSSGVLSREGVERLLRQRVEAALRGRTPLSLIVLDIDGLRRLNKTRGYAEADRALRALASAMRGVITQEEAVGRWSGGEFVVLTPRSGPSALALANSLRELAHGGALGGEAITLSVGVAEFDRGRMDDFALLSAAFDALAAVKRGGGNRAVLAGLSEGGH